MKKALIILFLNFILLASCHYQKQPSNNSNTEEGISTVISFTEESHNDLTEQSQFEYPHNDWQHFISATTENEKDIIAIFDEATISNIQREKNSGTSYSLSSNEVKAIIANMVSYFKTYDLICIVDINGVSNTYHGLSFYHSEEYFASFGVINPSTEASFDYKKDLLSATLKCIEVLHSNIYDGYDDFSKFVLNTSRTFTEAEEKELLGALNSIYELEGSSASSKAILSKYQFSGFYFDIKEEELIFIPLVSAADPSTKVSLITNETLPAKISPKKYDYNGQVIVIELYNNHTNSLVVRLRYDEKNNPEVIKKANELFYASIPNLSGAGNIFQRTQYKAVVYFNGFSFNYADTCISYAPDGDLNIFTFNDPYDLLYSLQNSKPLTEYLNQLLSDYLED